MKKIFLAALILIGFTAMASDPNEKVLQAFKQSFPNVDEVAWTEGTDSYEVKFKQNEILSKVTYDTDGNIMKTLRYYEGHHLPLLVQSKVRSKFSDKRIYGVTEEASEQGTFFHIILEDEKNWVQITSDIYGSIKVDKKFKKA